MKAIEIYIRKRIEQEKKELTLYSSEIGKNPDSALAVILEEKQNWLKRFEAKLKKLETCNLHPVSKIQQPESNNL